MAADALLRLHDVTKAYQEGEATRTVLDGVTTALAEGTFALLMGRSGSGKSTLLNLVSGIDRPDAGTIHVGDTELTGLSETQRTLFRRRRLGFVFQAFNLISTLTVRENVTLPLELSGETSDAAAERALAVLDEVGLPGRGDSFPDRLSGGEQQRVAIARALAHDPLLVLADEPTGNLDYETGQQVLALLTRLVRQYGKTLIVATHDRALLDAADTVLTLQGGTLTQHAPSEVPGAG
jgi:putative ABC transport system ATP-binding protein